MNIETLTPAILKQIPTNELPQLATEIRTFLIETVSKTGGHIGASLGVLELAIALHYVFSSPQTPILWDTGHQAYCHRLLTGRANRFPTLNQCNGMGRFLDPRESEHDILGVSHGGTAISTAVGLAYAMRMRGDTHSVVAVVGDGAMGEGLSWEGLDYLAGTDLPVVLVYNQNGYSIPPTVGGLKNFDQRLGDGNQTSAYAFFAQGLGLQYYCVEDGHDIEALIEGALWAQSSRLVPAVLHVKTDKGHGLAYAKEHPYRFHFSGPFDPATGAGASPTIAGRTYATVAAEALAVAMEHDPQIIVLTPSTPYASGLESLMAQYPDRVVDVGMKEQHAVSMAAGLALGGQKPVVCIQSTFLQRAYDQVMHDVCIGNLPVTFILARSGFAGLDHCGHHGLWDLPVLHSFPNMAICYPRSTQSFTERLWERLSNPEGPMAILHAYEPVQEPEIQEESRFDGGARYAHGRDGVLICLGNTLRTALAVRTLLAAQTGENFGVLCVERLKPFPLTAIHFQSLGMMRSRFVSIEEGILAGGLGTLVAGLHTPYATFLPIGVPDMFVPAGSKEECAAFCQMTPEAIVARIRAQWGAPVSRESLLQAGQPLVTEKNL